MERPERNRERRGSAVCGSSGRGTRKPFARYCATGLLIAPNAKTPAYKVKLMLGPRGYHSGTKLKIANTLKLQELLFSFSAKFLR